MIYFTAHTFQCVCHCRRAMFRVLGMYNFGQAPIDHSGEAGMQKMARQLQPGLTVMTGFDHRLGPNFSVIILF